MLENRLEGNAVSRRIEATTQKRRREDAVNRLKINGTALL